MKTNKKEKLSLAKWGDIYTKMSIEKCPKCDFRIRDLNVFGCVFLGVCDRCKKFYGIVVEDVTAKLTPKFKKNSL